MATASGLVGESLQRTNAHGLARLVNERRLYIKFLWLLAWLLCCSLFLRQLTVFVNRLQSNQVSSTILSDEIPFEYPDFYFCYTNPLSGSRHLLLSNHSMSFISSSFISSISAFITWCRELKDQEECEAIIRSDAAEVQLNSLPYKFLADHMAHIEDQSIFSADFLRSNGLVFTSRSINISEFYHPAHLRCFRVALTDLNRKLLNSAGPDDSLLFNLMMDAPDSRMGRSELPVVETVNGNLTAPYWALDKSRLFSRARDSRILVYITKPGHYPSDFNNIIVLEPGRAYDIQLEMSEHVHKEDPSKCIEQHPDVQLVNPYDHSAYTFHYDYAFCYNSAVQAQFKRELNATCAFLPHPWPPADRSLYNLSSGWGSTEDTRRYLYGVDRLRPEEPLEKCALSRLCSVREYTVSSSSVLWPSPDIIETLLEDISLPDSPNLPGLHYLKELITNKSTSKQAAEYFRANFIQLGVRAKDLKADQIIFSRAYSFDSFVADVGGILGIYLGMSLLTACEVAQFIHDLVVLCWSRSRNVQDNGTNEKGQDGADLSSGETSDVKTVRDL